LARYYGVSVPTTYVSRVRQLHAPHTFRRVLKDTTQMTVGTETYWITKLRAPQGPPLATQLDVAQAFPIPEGEQALRFCGYMSVADVDHLLHERPFVARRGAGQGSGRKRPPRAASPVVRHEQAPAQTMPAPGLSLGQTLRHAREAHGLSLRQVAARVQHEDGTPITAQHLAYVEQDRRKPRLRLLLALARLFALEPLAMLVRAQLGPAVVAEYLQAYPAQQAAVIQLFLEAKAQRFAVSDWEHVYQQLAALRHPVFRRSSRRSP
jgi:transcriptional regulator with XRE-family HTH domain